MQVGAVGIGDLTNFGLTGNGEPFMFAQVEGLGVFMALDGSTTVTISIMGIVRNVHKLDNRCLDLAWLPTVEKSDREVFAEATVADYANLVLYSVLPVGTNVAVIFDGVRYESSVAKESNSGYFVFGNLSIMNAEAFPNTGEPFIIYTPYETGYYNFISADGNEHTIAVYAVDEKYNVIPEGFLGGGRSSTFSLDDMGMPSVKTDTTETITVDTSEIINILISGGKVNLSFKCNITTGTSYMDVRVDAMLDGTKIKTNYHWSSLYYTEAHGLYAFIVTVTDATISVTNRKIA